MESQLRGRLSPKEYQKVIKQLEGAVAAVDLLARRDPAFLRYFFTGALPAIADGIPDIGREHLVGLVRELRSHNVAHAPVAPQPPRLRLVKS